jgi:hypothetical protein
VDASPSNRPVALSPPRRSLSPGERLVCVAAAIIVISLFLPWYGIRFTDFSSSGFGSFGFGAAALLVTAGAAVVGAFREAAGKPPSPPLRTAELVLLAGGWATLIAVYLIFDRPDLHGSTSVSPRLGVYVALAGAVLIVAAGMRMRMER